MYLKKQIGLTFLLMAVLIPDGQARSVSQWGEGRPGRDSLKKVTDVTPENAKDYTIKKCYDPNSQTYYYLTRIRHRDEHGHIIKLHQAFAGKPEGETGTEFVTRTGYRLAINGSTARATKSPDGKVIRRIPTGTQIIDGVIKQQLRRSYFNMGIKKNNKLTSYLPGTSPQDMIADGSKTVLSGFVPLLEDGMPVGEDVLKVYTGYDDKHPRQVVGQYDNMDLVFLSCGGRDIQGKGMTAAELIRVLQNEGVKFAFMIDGGGSVTLMAEGKRITPKMDIRGTRERPRPNFLYIK